MNSPLAKNLLKYGISAGIGLVLTGSYVLARVDLSGSQATALVEWYRILCDGFTVPGLVMVMLGCLMSLSTQGALDGVRYIASIGIKMLIPGGALNMEKYAEYKERRNANRTKGYGFLYVVGFAFLAFALIFMILFYSIYQK